MLLFVCTGNTCRSPLAAAMARQRGISAESAGLYALPGAPATPQAVRTARRHGMDLTAHRAQPVTEALLARASRVLTMTPEHADALRERFPSFAGKIASLSPAIPDPYGGDDGDYEICFQELEAALNELKGV